MIASRSADSRPASGTPSSKYDGKQPKSAGIDTGGGPNAKNPSFTPDPPHATGKTRSSAKSVPQVQWRLSGFPLLQVSADESFLTALFRTCGGPCILSSSYAAEFLENVGYTTKLDATIEPLTPDAWYLTSLVDHLPGSGRGTCQLVSALPSVQPNRVDNTSLPDNGRPHGDVGDETQSRDYDSSSDEGDECSSDVMYEHMSSGKKIRWSEEDDNRLRRWKEAGKPWGWICRQFSNRSPGAVQVRWHTKLRAKA